MANKLRGEVDFPEGGEGIVLRCLPSALIELQAKFGKPTSAFEPDAEMPEFGRLISRIGRLDADVICTAAKIFAKKGDKKDVDAKLNIDAIEVPFAVVQVKVLDAIMLGVHGKTWEEMQATPAPEAKGDGERPQTDSSGS